MLSRIRTRRSGTLLCVLALATTLSVEVAFAAPTAAELAHPDLAPDLLLAKVIPEIQKTFIDPGSTQQFQLCRPHHVKVKDGALVSWAAMFVANTRNASGGFDGRTLYNAIYNKGRTQVRTGPSLVGGQHGFDMLIAREMERQTSNCPRIADDRLKALLTH